MSDKKKNWLPIAAVVLAIVAAVLFYYITKDFKTQVDVYVATTNIKPRTKITRGMIRTKQIAKVGRHMEYLEKDKIFGSYAVTNIYKGQQIIKPQLSKTEGIDRLTSYISEGNRAVTISLNAVEENFAGMLQVGDRIDIIANFVGGQDSTIGLNLTQPILYNVEIIKISRSSGKIQAVIVELSPKQAMTYFFAKAHAKGFNYTLIPFTDTIRNNQVIDGILPQNFLQDFGFGIKYNR